LIRTSFFHGGSIRGLFLIVNGYFASCCIENRWLAMLLGKEGGSGADLLRNQQFSLMSAGCVVQEGENTSSR
jgi:hypothetical protein